MYVALTGTPGTGKTEACAILNIKGFKVESVNELAARHGAAVETDEGVEIDVGLLSQRIQTPDETIIIEGHLAHLLANDVCVVLRCNPNILRDRLESRGYSEDKVRENMEAEAIDLILVEALDRCGKVCEIDTTGIGVDEVVYAIEKIINGDIDGYPPGKVDWSQVVMDWY